MRTLSSGALSLIVCDVVFSAIAIVAVALRIQAIRVRGRQYRSHDYLIFGALVMSIAFGVDQIIGSDPGATGLHVAKAEQELGLDSLVLTLKTFFAAEFLWITATTLVKLSILTLYVEIFGRGLSRLAVFAIGGVTISFFVGDVLMALLICKPIAFNWDRTLDGTCGSTISEEIALAGINMALDISLVALPMPILWRLQMPLKKKLAVSSMLSFGFGICAINITRIVLVSSADQADYTYSLTNAALFSALEVYIGILTACVPTFGPLLSRGGLGSSTRTAKDNRQIGSGLDTASASQKRRTRAFDQAWFERLDDEEIELRGFGKSKTAGMDRAAWARAENASDVGLVANAAQGSQAGVISVRTDIEVLHSPSAMV